jgi:hypothetical protein
MEKSFEEVCKIFDDLSAVPDPKPNKWAVDKAKEILQLYNIEDLASVYPSLDGGIIIEYRNNKDYILTLTAFNNETVDRTLYHNGLAIYLDHKIIPPNQE